MKVKAEAKIFLTGLLTGRRSVSGQITIDYYDDLGGMSGGYPASEPLSCGSSTSCVSDNINADNYSYDLWSSSSNRLSNSTPYNSETSTRGALSKKVFLKIL